MLHWSERHETGHPQIDEEHREIFSRLNAIGEAIERGADSAALAALIQLLLDYSYRHFHHEEHAMRCGGCPFQDRNCAAHRGFIERLQHWLALTNYGTVPISLLSDVHGETCRWIESHVASVDIGLRQSAPAEPAHLAC